MPPPIHLMNNLTKQLPAAALDMLRGTIEGLIKNLPLVKGPLSQFLKSSASAGVSTVVTQMVDRFLSEAVVWLERFRPFLDSSTKVDSASLSFIPPEIFLIVPALKKKVAKGNASPMELVAAAFLQDIQNLFAGEPEAKPPASPASPSVASYVGLSVMDLERKFTAVVTAMPELRSLDAIFNMFDLPPIAERGIRSYWTSTIVPNVDKSSDYVKVNKFAFRAPPFSFFLN